MTWEYTELDPWSWRVAQESDIEDICDLCVCNFQREIDSFFTPDRLYYAYQLHLAITHQTHLRAKELLIVSRDSSTNKLLAYAWLAPHNQVPFTQELVAEAKMAHVDLALSPRTRIKLLYQIIQFWKTWTKACGIKTLISTSIREDQGAFMRLHEKLGFTVRGSFAYIKLGE